ncbi:MAG: TonB-dependent receptor plug domain-containing protein, partial [Gammaproteobacteria bacterium]
MLNHSPSARAAVAMMAIVLFAPPLFAQPKMEEITVTARKTEESLQEVPISISAFTGTQMRDRGIQNNYGVAAFTPNFNTSQRVGRQLDRPTIRGMANPASRGEPNASYFIDGIFVSSSISTATTQSMERVEVLRGPQSAQFGRATFSGAINYVTRRPTNEYEGDIFLRYGTHEDRQIGAWFSGPIIEDKLMFLVSGNQQNYGGQWNNDLPPLETGELRPINSGDPFFDRVFEVPGPEGNPEGPPDTTVDQLGLGDNSSIGEEKTTDLLVKLMWTPFDSTEVTAKYGYTEGEDSHFTSNVLPTTLGDSGFPGLNCYLPDDPSQPWYGTSIGDFCGEQTIEGAINRLNIPDINYGLTVADNGFNGPLPPETKTAQPARPGLGRETHRFLGEWVQDIGDWTSTLRAAHNEDTFDAAYDFDKQDARAVWGLFAFVSIDEVEDDQFEWSIASPVDKPIRGRLGVFWYERDRSFIQRSITGPEPVFGQLPGTLFPAPRLEGTENQAVFGSLSFDLAPNWRLDFEGRYAEDTKIITGNQISSETEELTVVNAEQAFSNFT